MHILHRFAYAPSNDDFFSTSSNEVSCVPRGVSTVETRGFEGLKNGEFGIGWFLPADADVVDFMMLFGGAAAALHPSRPSCAKLLKLTTNNLIFLH